jgi:hypothetical protein
MSLLLDERPFISSVAELASVTAVHLDQAMCHVVGKVLQRTRVSSGSYVFPRFSVVNVENVCHPMLAKRFADACTRQWTDTQATSLKALLLADREAHIEHEAAEIARDPSLRKQAHVAPTLRDLGPRLLFHGVASEDAMQGIIRQGLVSAGDRLDDGQLLAMASGYERTCLQISLTHAFALRP